MTMRMKIFITIAIVMMTKFMNRSHNSCRDGGDGCDCDDERMTSLMLLMAIAMRMKIDLRAYFRCCC